MRWSMTIIGADIGLLTFGAKPVPEPVLTYYLLIKPQGTYFNKVSF